MGIRCPATSRAADPFPIPFTQPIAMWITTTAALLLGGAPATAPLSGPPPSLLQETPAAPMTPDEAQAKFLALEDEFDEARQAYYTEMRAKWEAHSEAGGDGSTFEPAPPIEPDFFPRFLALADAGVAGANGWVLMNWQHSGIEGAEAREAKTQRLLSVLAASPDDDVMMGLCSFLSNEASTDPRQNDPEGLIGPEASFAFLDVIRHAAKTDELSAYTLFTRGSCISDRQYYDADADLSAANVWYERAANEYPETEWGSRCGGYVFAANNLQIGQLAPDIVGKDHDGNDIRRSDFEGKITVLDFWGFW